MKIIFGCSTCSQNKFAELEKKNNMSDHAIQKYNLLLIKGFAANSADVQVFSGLPISRAVTSKKIINEKDDVEDGARFHYFTTINFPAIRQLMVFFGAFFGVLKTKKEIGTYAVCDCLNIANMYGIIFASKLKKIPVSLIVTDLPEMMFGKGMLSKINNRAFKKADSFILLTEQMNEKVNSKHKPHIVLEGHVDSRTPERNALESYEKTNGKKIVIYAGSLRRIYGIGALVKGFISADIPDSELWIYGDGDFRDELEALSNKHKSVIYKGIKSNSEIVEEEQKAALLVNPRPTAPEYTKYSFPSKNMEYMVSGTPVLTTKLPGMPKEYLPYVYLIGEDDEYGISSALKSVFLKPLSERNALGESAREFVLKNKTNVIQAKKILEFLSKDLSK